MTQVDTVMDRMIAVVARVKASQGSLVSLSKAELDLLAQIELARDLMMEALKNQNDRTLLRDIFGGDCARLVRIRAICESIEFSDMNKSDQRLPTCLRACQSVEKVIIDLGDGEALRKAQACLEAALKEKNGLEVLSEAVAKDISAGHLQSENSTPPDSARSSRRDAADSSADRSAERILQLLRADTERTEAQLRGELTACQEKVEKEILNCDSRLQEDLAGFQESLQTIVDKWEERLSSCESKLDQIPVDLAKHKSDTDECARQAQELQSCLQATVGGIESRLVEVERTLDAHGSASRQCQAKLEELSSCIAQAKLEDMSSCIVQLTEKQQESETRLSSLDLSLASAEARIEANWTDFSASGKDVREGLAGVKKTLERQVADSANELQSLLDKINSLSSDLHEGRESWQSQLATEMQRAERCWLEAAEAASRRETKNLETTLTENLGARAQELEKLRSKYDMDSVWESFAHVGKLIRNLEKRLDDSGIAGATTPRNPEKKDNSV